MKNSNIRNYKEKIIKDKSDEVMESSLRTFFEDDLKEPTEDQVYNEDDTLDEFVKEVDIENLLRFISVLFINL